MRIAATMIGTRSGPMCLITALPPGYSIQGRWTPMPDGRPRALPCVACLRFGGLYAGEGPGTNVPLMNAVGRYPSGLVDTVSHAANTVRSERIGRQENDRVQLASGSVCTLQRLCSSRRNWRFGG